MAYIHNCEPNPNTNISSRKYKYLFTSAFFVEPDVKIIPFREKYSINKKEAIFFSVTDLLEPNN